MNKNFASLLATAILITTFSFTVFPQNVEIVWGKEVKMDKRASLGTVIGHEEKAYYVLKNTYRGFMSTTVDLLFEQYDMNHRMQNSRVLKTTVDNGKECEYEGIFQLKDRFVMFLSRFDSKTDKQYLYAVNMDKDGTQEKAVIVDSEVAKKKSQKGFYSFVQAEDKSKLLVFRAAAYDKKGTEKFKYKMITPSLEVLWEKDIELPYKDKDFAIDQYRIDDVGNVFLLGHYKLNKKDDYSQFKIFAYDYKKDKLEDIKINFTKAKYINNLRFFYNKGALHLTGFFNSEKGGVAGIFYNKINSKTFRVEVERNEPFSKATLSKFISERKIRKGKGISIYFEIKDIIVGENEDITLVAEDNHVVVTTTTTQNGSTRTTYRYYYNDIAVMRFDKAGELKWIARVPKLQYSVNDGATYSSYVMVYDKDNMYFLFNDNPANGAVKKSEDDDPKEAKLNKIKKATIMLATVNNDGKVKQEIYFKSKNDGKASFVPSNNARLSSTKTWITGLKGKVYKYGFLTTTKE